MIIRQATEKDIPGLLKLLQQVLEIHAKIRPDIFVSGTTKYYENDLKLLLQDDHKPIYVAVDEAEAVLGYAFCQLKEPSTAEYMVKFRNMFIDDLCVDEACRGQHLGEKLFEHVKSEAKRLGCFEITLNVWSGNESAERFYEKMGMSTKERQMEYIL